MSELSLTCLDRLTRYGVLNELPQVQTNAFKPQDMNTQESDKFDSERKKTPSWKTYATIGLITYLVGVLCSKGRLNIIDCAKGTYEFLVRLGSNICKLFKKS